MWFKRDFLKLKIIKNDIFNRFCLLELLEITSLND